MHVFSFFLLFLFFNFYLFIYFFYLQLIFHYCHVSTVHWPVLLKSTSPRCIYALHGLLWSWPWGKLATEQSIASQVVLKGVRTDVEWSNVFLPHRWGGTKLRMISEIHWLRLKQRERNTETQNNEVERGWRKSGWCGKGEGIPSNHTKAAGLDCSHYGTKNTKH